MLTRQTEKEQGRKLPEFSVPRGGEVWAGGLDGAAGRRPGSDGGALSSVLRAPPCRQSSKQYTLLSGAGGVTGPGQGQVVAL